ncbi:MAG: CRISPR-associated protein Cas4 [Bacilli bacterium]
MATPTPIPEWYVEDWVTLSALQHYSYCARQWALIYKEQTFHENLYTMKGRLAYERADDEGALVEEGVPVLRALTVWSDRHG